MSAVRCPSGIENFHIFLKGQCENTFIMSVDCSTDTKVLNIFEYVDSTQGTLKFFLA